MSGESSCPHKYLILENLLISDQVRGCFFLIYLFNVTIKQLFFLHDYILFSLEIL